MKGLIKALISRRIEERKELIFKGPGKGRREGNCVSTTFPSKLNG